MTAFHGFDHVDTRVRSLADVEAFYDALMPELGLPCKTFAHVDAKGDWHPPEDGKPYNAVEYHTARVPGAVDYFIGFIEDGAMSPTKTRIAIRVEHGTLAHWLERLHALGAHCVELSADMEDYPAIFFEDAAGTKLEICARNAAPAGDDAGKNA